MISDIVNDGSLSISERIEKLLLLCGYGDDADGPSSAEELRFAADSYRALIDMIKAEDALASHTLELFQLYTLLAEALDELEDYRPLDSLSFEIREVLRDSRISWDVIKTTLPRIIDVISGSVYHTETYRLLLVFLSAASKADSLDAGYARYVTLFLKLRILLGDEVAWGEYLFDRKLESDMAASLSTSQYLKIILHPRIGSLNVDPVEYTSRWEKIYYDVEDKLKERFANAPRGMGFCHLYWSAKRALLRDEYGIDWSSPSQMNPRVMFD